MSNFPSLWYHYSFFSFAHNFSSQAFSDNPIGLIERKGKRMIYWVVPFLMVGGRWKSAIDGGAWARSRTEMLILPKASVQCWFITIGQESVPEKRQKVNLASLYFYFFGCCGYYPLGDQQSDKIRAFLHFPQCLTKNIELFCESQTHLLVALPDCMRRGVRSDVQLSCTDTRF